MPDYNRYETETGMARAARIRRETNKENDALCLVEGDWINYKHALVRFRASHIDRKSPSLLRRATAEEVAMGEARETRICLRKAKQLEREEWMKQPHVLAAFRVHLAIENNILTAVARLTPQEWIDLADRLLGRSDASGERPNE